MNGVLEEYILFEGTAPYGQDVVMDKNCIL